MAIDRELITITGLWSNTWCKDGNVYIYIYLSPRITVIDLSNLSWSSLSCWSLISIRGCIRRLPAQNNTIVRLFLIRSDTDVYEYTYRCMMPDEATSDHHLKQKIFRVISDADVLRQSLHSSKHVENTK